MRQKLPKEKLVRALVNTFNDRDELHIEYKKKMKEILSIFASALAQRIIAEEEKEFDLREFIDIFVEERFKPQN